MEVSALSTEEFAAFVGREIEKYQAIIKAAGIKPE
jgi:tripartite-type tricarboxylate transporter receptor subunit TctC